MEIFILKPLVVAKLCLFSVVRNNRLCVRYRICNHCHSQSCAPKIFICLNLFNKCCDSFAKIISYWNISVCRVFLNILCVRIQVLFSKTTCNFKYKYMHVYYNANYKILLRRHSRHLYLFSISTITYIIVDIRN